MLGRQAGRGSDARDPQGGPTRSGPPAGGTRHPHEQLRLIPRHAITRLKLWLEVPPGFGAISAGLYVCQAAGKPTFQAEI